MKWINIISIAVVFIVSHCSVGEVRGVGSFSKQIEMINQEVEKWYHKESNIGKNLKLMFASYTDANLQSVQTHWPRQLMRVLQVATGVSSSSQVDMTRVFRILEGLRQNKKPIEVEFRANIGEFVSTKFILELEYNMYFDDKDDLGEFIEEVKDELCIPFRQDKNKKYFDFEGAINDLIQTAKAENIGNEQFVEQVIRSNEPIAPLYSAAMICQLIIDGLSQDNQQFKFEVSSHNNHVINNWPYSVV